MAIPRVTVPTVEERLKELKQLREEALAAHELSKQRMAQRITSKGKPYKVGDKEGLTTRWDTPSPDSWSPIIPLDPLVAPLTTPISPAPLPSPLLLPTPPPTQASPSPAPSPIPQYIEALADQLLEAMEDGSDKENIPPRAVTPYPDTPHLLQSEFYIT
ncbi:hypothetical protein M378DRAFT_18402 [Amanita muscaria Koide BX008]|uniref:Uncharacterized protein n=1 Tax=Amanita muscaria (strain Koide BX008) TaxID=946122 RepID=A0A0C2SLY7_AMAMK|nr:hypothetical protein M378DRAFT_18402 [Amanita muscaria Koide BX008]